MSLLLLFNAPPPAGGVSQTLAGQSDGVSTLTGRFVIDLKATSASSSTTAGAFAIDLKGTSASSSTLTGKFAIDLKGTSASASTATGALVRTVGLAGQSNGTSGMSGDPHLDVGLAGTSSAVGDMTANLFLGMSAFASSTAGGSGNLAVRYVIAGESDSVSLMGALLLPSPSLLPSPTLWLGIGVQDLTIQWALGGSAAALSSMKGGTTALAGVLAALSDMGIWRYPATNVYPSPSLYPGLKATDLAVGQLGQDNVLITLTASVDVRITIEADADLTGSLMSNALLVTLGASDG